jgi:hypothetical protein
MNPKHPRGPPMTPGNMREQGVRHRIAFFDLATVQPVRRKGPWAAATCAER